MQTELVAKDTEDAEPISLAGFELPLALQITDVGSKLFLYDSSPQNEDGLIFFATLSGLAIHGLSQDWFCDGTFLTAPNVNHQIYRIHVSNEVRFVPPFRLFIPTKKRIKLLLPSQYPNSLKRNKKLHDFD